MNRGSHHDGDPDRHPDDQASMRPRFMNRGSREYQRERLRPLLASMRPRFMNRGSGPDGTSFAWRVKLQ